MIIDVAYFIVLLYAIFKGFTKGLIVGIFSLLAFIIGLAAALKLSSVVANYFADSTATSTKWLPVLSFLLVFIAVVFIINIGARLIKKSLRLVMLGWIDKMGGILLYFIIYTIIFSVILFFAIKVSIVDPDTIANSRMYHFVAPWGPGVIDNLGKIIPVFKGLFNELQLFFERLATKIS